MKHWLFAALLFALTPGIAVAEHSMPKASSPEAPAKSAGYMTFPLHAGKGGPATGCLWRLPMVDEGGLEVYAALSAVRTGETINAALQVAGSSMKDGKKVAASFSEARLSAGPSFDTGSIATQSESGPTARVAFPGVHAMAMVTALNDHDGKLFFTHDGKKHEAAIPRPSADDTAHIWFCLTQLQAESPKKAAE